MFKNLPDADPGLGAGGDGVGGVDADDFFDFLPHPLWLGVDEVHLVEHGNDFNLLLEGGIAGGDGLRLDPLGGVHHEQGAFAGGKRTGHLVAEIDMAGGVDEVQLVALAVGGAVMQGDALGLDGDAALALDVEAVEHLGRHLALAEPAA